MIDRQPVEIIAYHGWGYDQFCWQNWQSLLPPNWKFQRFDRGYFDRPFLPTFNSSSATKIIFAHSFGLHLCPFDQLQQADYLILFSSFLHFHPENDRLQKRSMQILDRMIEQFQIQPEVVLKNFRDKACYPAVCEESTPSNFNHSLLLADLQQLGISAIDPIHFEKIPNILILAGDGDRIISPIQIQQLREKLPFSEYDSIDAGHALPFTHLQECWSLIQQYLHRSTSVKSKIAIEFGRSPATYHAQASLQKACADRLLSLLDDRTIPEGKILEIGCGTGFITQKLIDQFGDRSFVITDLSSEMLTFCQENLNLSPLETPIQFQQLDGECLDFENQFALIVAGFVMQWFQSIDNIQRLINHLKPGGLLLISFPSCKSFPEWKAVCQQLNLPFTLNPLPDPQLIQHGGTWKAENISTKFASAADFFRSIKAIGAGFNTTGQQLTRSQMKRLIQAWDAQSSGKIEVSHHIVYGVIERS